MEDALESLLGSLRKSQRTVITLVVEALASLRQAASISIALVVAQRTGCRVPSALIRFYRLLHNPRIDDLAISRKMLSLLGQRTSPVVLALDWTEWHSDLRVLSASAAMGTRAIPVYVAATAVGQAIVEERPDIQLPCKIKGPRLSLLHLALLWGPAFARSSPLSTRFIVEHLPPPVLRDFAWLHKFEKAS